MRAERRRPAAETDSSITCAVFDDVRGRPCGEPVEVGTLTCPKHRARPTRTQVSRNDAARRRYSS
jgi:hypothetical protein